MLYDSVNLLKPDFQQDEKYQLRYYLFALAWVDLPEDCWLSPPLSQNGLGSGGGYGFPQLIEARITSVFVA